MVQPSPESRLLTLSWFSFSRSLSMMAEVPIALSSRRCSDRRSESTRLVPCEASQGPGVSDSRTVGRDARGPGSRAESYLSVRSFQLPGRDGAHVQVPVLLLLADGVIAFAAGGACLVLAGPVLGPPLAFRSAQVGECGELRKKTGSSPAGSPGPSLLS